MSFAGKTIIITGGGSGIGRVAAIRFGGEGANVVVADIHLNSAQETASIVEQNGGNAISVKVDVSQEDQVITLISRSLEVYGAIHVLVNNAAVIMPKTIEATSSEEWDRIFLINTKSVFLCSKYALQELKRNQGRIVNVASLNGVIGQKGNTAYASSKGAVIALTKSMAVDYAPSGVRINCVCPAGVVTPLLETWLSSVEDGEKARKEQGQAHLLGYIASPQEIVDVILFLASDASSFITGQAIVVDGGASLGYGAGPKAEWTSTCL